MRAGKHRRSSKPKRRAIPVYFTEGSEAQLVEQAAKQAERSMSTYLRMAGIAQAKADLRPKVEERSA